MPLSQLDEFDRMIEQLDVDGFTVLRGALSSAEVDAHLAEFEPAIRSLVRRYREQSELPDELSETKVFHAAGRFVRDGMAARYPDSSSAQRIFFNPQAFELARRRFGREPVFAHGSTGLYPIALPDGPAYMRLPHADFLSAAAPDPWTLGLRFWCALEDIDPRSGPFYIRKGSHRLVSEQVTCDVLDADPELARDMIAQLDVVGRERWFPVASRYHEAACLRMHELCEELDLETVVFTPCKGDIVVFNPATVHGTRLCEDERLTRKHTLYNLVAKDAPYYHGRAWWGPRHDYRRPENDIRFRIERTGYGLRWVDYLQHVESTADRPVVH